MNETPVPHWERLYPGRFQWELDALKRVGAAVEIDAAQLAGGVLALSISWPRPSGPIRLQAIYPDTFPFTRPEIVALDAQLVRHQDPIGRTLCLLGRGTYLWTPSWTVAQYLTERLEKVLDAAANPGSQLTATDEEHVGEPVEYWWNTTASADSYCLVDSSWVIDRAHSYGTLKIRCAVKPRAGQHGPIIRGLVEEVRGADGTVLHSWQGAMPTTVTANGITIFVPWARLDKPPVPSGEGDQLGSLQTAHSSFQKYGPRLLAPGVKATLFAVVFDDEIQWRTMGCGWIFVSAVNLKGSSGTTLRVVRTLRAGNADLRRRVPSIKALENKRVVVVGLGAIGAPIAIELARNGCADLRLIEPDFVEPGITVRWPLGATAWGKRKVDSVEVFIKTEYPDTATKVYEHRLGECAVPGEKTRPGSAAILEDALSGADLVIDATAELGIALLLSSICRTKRLLLITAHATPSLDGGVVARFDPAPHSACRQCLEYAWKAKSLPEPVGAESADLQQAPGCAERTFSGASFDLSEISLQTVRTAVDSLSTTPEYDVGSYVQIVRFRSQVGRRIPPVWESHALAVSHECEWPHK